MTELSVLDQAQATQVDLRGKVDGAHAALQALDERRSELAYEAHAVGGEAKKELDRLNKARLSQLAEIETLEVAVLEASRRVVAAEQAANAVEMSERAERGLQVAVRLREHASKLDEALRLVFETSKAFESDLRTLNALGCRNPTEFQFESLGTRAFKAGVMGSPLQIEHLAPRERHSFSELADGWVKTIESWAARWLRKDAA